MAKNGRAGEVPVSLRHDGPLVSVIVPTRERPDTLRHALRTVVEQTYPHLEIIVSDNASSPATAEVVKTFTDPRIRYINTGRRVSMTENFEFALAHATGEWIAVIGDDDAILPSGVERAVQTVRSAGVQALGSAACHYRWPFPDDSGPTMFLTVPVGRGFEVVDARERLKAVLNDRLPFTTLPMTYTGGFVARTLIEEIRGRLGSFYHSQIPDVYSATAICSVVDRFAFMREPIMIAGVSRHSIGHDILGSTGKAFTQETTIPLHQDLALVNGEMMPIASMLVYECYLQSRFLRDHADDTTPAQQFERVRRLSQQTDPATPMGAFMSVWARRYAQQHGLPDHRPSPTLAQRVRGQIGEWRLRAERLTSDYRIDRASGHAWHSVYDAAQAAEQLVQHRPSLAANLIASTLRRAGLRATT